MTTQKEEILKDNHEKQTKELQMKKENREYKPVITAMKLHFEEIETRLSNKVLEYSKASFMEANPAEIDRAKWNDYDYSPSRAFIFYLTLNLVNHLYVNLIEILNSEGLRLDRQPYEDEILSNYIDNRVVILADIDPLGDFFEGKLHSSAVEKVMEERGYIKVKLPIPLPPMRGSRFYSVYVYDVEKRYNRGYTYLSLVEGAKK